MTQTTKTLHRVLFCIGVNQNFFDLPTGKGIDVWKGFSNMLNAMSKLQGLNIIGTIDDDRMMVGPSISAPWTVYIMADVDDTDTVVAACNLFRTTPVGEYSLWRYAKIEARIGRALEIPKEAL